MSGALRRLAAQIAAAARRVDRHAGRALGRARVLVEARTPMNLAVLWPVIARLLDDPRIDVRVTGPERADLERAFAGAGLRDRRIARTAARWTRVDLYMNADPWEAVRLRRAARQLNFFHGVAGKYDLDCPTALPLNLARYDRVAFPNESRLQSYVRAGLVTAQQAALVGYPKVDLLANEPEEPGVAARRLGLDPARPCVIFAPTFSPASALHEAGEVIIGTLLDCGCNVIVKLHDRSFDPDPRYSAGVDWRQRLQRFSDNTRFLLARSGDSTPFLLASNLMVSDHSSIAFEFCILDRPLILFDAPRLAGEARINPEKVRLLRSAAFAASDASTLAAAVRAALANPAAHSGTRRQAAAQVFYRPGGATDRAVRLAYELMELEPTAATAATPIARAWSLE